MDAFQAEQESRRDNVIVRRRFSELKCLDVSNLLALTDSLIAKNLVEPNERAYNIRQFALKNGYITFKQKIALSYDLAEITAFM